MNTQEDMRIAEITEQMIVDYTAWINGEPIAWNFKKREARKAIADLSVTARIDELTNFKYITEDGKWHRHAEIRISELNALRSNNEHTR